MKKLAAMAGPMALVIISAEVLIKAVTTRNVLLP